jgi:hypothetical protein
VSRSREKTPIVPTANTSGSEKEDKVRAHRALRRGSRQAIQRGDEVLPGLRDGAARQDQKRNLKPEELAFRAADKVNDKALGNVFGLEGRARLGPYDSRSSAVIIEFRDESISKPILLSASNGLPSVIESALSSVEPVRVRFKIDARRGLVVVGCQLPTKNGRGWGKWQKV